MSLWDVSARPPPEGIEINLVDPEDQRALNIGCHTICLTLVTLCVAMRLYTRQFITHTFGWDDCLIILSFLLAIAFSGCIIKSYDYGVGRHLWDTPAILVPGALKMFQFATFVYVVLGASYRLAILAIYYRIFTVNVPTRSAIIAGFILIPCINISILFWAIFLCDPPAKAWNALLPGKCLDPKLIAYATGAVNVGEDLYVLILPIPMVYKMQMPLSRKLRVASVFGLGIFALVASIVRLIKTKVLVSNLDTTRDLSELGFWATIEVNVAIMCACLIVLPGFLERHWPSLASKFNSKNKSRLNTSSFSNSGKGAGLGDRPTQAIGHRGWTQTSSAHTSDENLTSIPVTHELEMNSLNLEDR